MYKIKEGIKQVNGDAKTVLRNLDKLVESASLVVIAVFSYLVVRGNINPTTLSEFSKVVIVAACVVIAMRGAFESLRYLANK